MNDHRSSFRRLVDNFIDRAVLWLFRQLETAGEKVRREKMTQARKMLEDLHSQRVNLGVEEIVEALYKIHNFFRLPWYYPWERKQKIYLMEIGIEIKKSAELNPELIKRLLKMLSWDELEESSGSFMKNVILSKAKEFLSPALLPELRDYVTCLLTRRQKEEPETPGYGVLGDEINKIEQLIMQCESAE